MLSTELDLSMRQQTGPLAHLTSQLSREAEIKQLALGGRSDQGRE